MISRSITEKWFNDAFDERVITNENNRLMTTNNDTS